MLHQLLPLDSLLFALALRGMPLAAYALLARKASARVRVALLAGYLALLAPLLAASAWRPILLWTVLGLGYYTVVGCGVHRCTRFVRAGQVTRGAAFALAAISCIALPALYVHDISTATFLAFGCDAMLSSYSYCVEVARRDAEPSLGECLFFLLVNPALVFTSRGEALAAPAKPAATSGRLVLGLATFCSGALLLSALAHFGLLGAWFPNRVSAAATFGALRFLSEYAAQAGLASFQIATLALLGYRAPEGYDYPLLARDPRDLWQRWNRYVGSWLYRYVFKPLAQRWRRTRWRAVAAPGVVLATFGVSAALHSGYSYFASFSFDLAAVAFLLANGVVVALWPLLARGLQQLIPVRAALSTALSRACLVVCLLSAVATWG